MAIGIFTLVKSRKLTWISIIYDGFIGVSIVMGIPQ